MSSIHADPPPPIVTDPTGINYATGPALGKGGFAICHRAERYEGSKPTGSLVALKIVKTKMEPAKLAQKFVTELQIHSKLSHPNIVTFYRAFSFGTSTYVVLELCSNGSLADMLRKRKYLTLPEIRRFVIQICAAVKYLHYRHIVHRDLKTGNLFLDERMNVKVGDFGLAALLVTEKDMAVQRRTTMCGTPNYLAPEILEKGKGHDEKVDLWAIGVIAYTLAVGKAPFHASTKEEIYRKLKSGTYTWPELTSTTNQSADLRDLVSSLLVPEEQRLVPDKIVSQNFFKIAFVPSSIPVMAREKAPRWSNVSLPSIDAVQRGYSDSWFALCKESGVGEYAEGKCFKLNGGRRVRSIVHDMAQEALLGKQPSMPIPKDTIYSSMIYDISPETKPEKRPASKGLAEIANNEVQLPRSRLNEAEYKVTTDAELMPPPPPRTESRAGKASVRKAARTISEETAKVAEALKISPDDPAAPLDVTKTRRAPTTAVAALKDLNVAVSQTSSASSRTTTVREKPSGQGSTTRSADASLARRPRGTKLKERQISPNTYEVPAIPAAPRSNSPDRKVKRHIKEADIVHVLSDKEDERPLRPAETPFQLPPLPQSTSRFSIPQDKSALSDLPTATKPAQVLERLEKFRANLSAAIVNRSLPYDTITQETETPSRITRWVDYSRKHGIGYVLADGTVGCIINASAKMKMPVTHVIVRNGHHWLSRVGKAFDCVDAIPMEIFEDCGPQGLQRKTFPSTNLSAAESERKRTLSVLWIKFGRYMCQSLDGEEDAQPAAPTNFVRFYQRIGSVGMWAYLDGSLQVHFPDHTKLVLSADGRRISATCISPEAAAYLETHQALLQQHINGRETFNDTVAATLHSCGRLRARYVRANAIREKLEFIANITGQWTRNGGLGCLDEDNDRYAPPIQWRGLSAKDLGDGRVTVGRFGGDEVVQST